MATPTRRTTPAIAGACLAAVLSSAAAQAAVSVRAPVAVAVRARLDVHLVAVETAGRWTATSRSPSDPSRFMADLTAGEARTGTLYLKGVSIWRDADDALGRVAFRFGQGDYHKRFGLADSAAVEARVFADERRYFTAELGTALVDDDEAAGFEHRRGVRLDANGRDARAIYWISALDDGASTRLNQYASGRYAGRPLFAALGYLHDSPDAGEDRAIAKGELAGYFRSATAIVSYEQSGFGSGAFLPSGSWDDFDAGDYARAAPDNSATFAEVRTRRTRVGDDHLFDASYRYGAVGSAYVNDLAALAPGTVSNAAWLNWAHRRYALDARLALRREVAWGRLEQTRQGAELTSRARLRNNAELLVRGGAARDERAGEEEDTRGFVHGAFTRELAGFLGGAHLMVDEIGGDATTSAGAEARVNWSATSAVYARWMVRDGAGDAVFLRLEFRPTRRTWVTFAYGRDHAGDDAWFLEDRDVPPSQPAGDRFSFSVRGDL